MKNKSLLHNDEIDLVGLFKTIYNEKIKVIIIIIISLFIGIGYNSQLPPSSHLHSLTIKPSDSSEFARLNSITYYFQTIHNLNLNRTFSLKGENIKEYNQMIANRFVSEINDYEEFTLSIKETLKSKESVSQIPIENQQEEMFNYTGLFEINKSENNFNEFEYILTLRWQNTQEAKSIMKNTIELTLKNLQKSIFKELEQDFITIVNIIQNKDSKELEFLYEQSQIARELNIEGDKSNNFLGTEYNVFNINLHKNSYYLKGFKSIDKEIEVIKNRKYPNLAFMREELDYLKNSTINWMNYNIHFMDVKSNNRERTILMISIFLGLLVGIFYAIIKSAFQSKSLKKIN